VEQLSDVPEQQRAEAGPDAEVEGRILAELVRGAMQSLSSDQRSAIQLVYYYGLSSNEVGRILGVPPPTVRSRLRLGLLKLGSALQAQGLTKVD
jgi:RNA polymerase sigma-70 factor (ECF subfamily)